MIFFDRGIESTISFIGIYILKGAPQRDIIYRPRIDLTLLIFALKRGREKKEISFFPIISLSRLLNCNFALQHDDNIKLIRFNKKKRNYLSPLYYFFLIERTTNGIRFRISDRIYNRIIPRYYRADD